MKLRQTLPLFVGLIVAACAGDAAEESAEATEMASAETMATDNSADVAALADLAAQFVTHYNLHHASMVADFYADDAVGLMADGAVNEGKAAILARLESDMEGQPTLALNQADAMVAGDVAVAHGTWQVATTVEGQSLTMAGNYMSLNTRAGADWKLQVVITNYNAPPPEGMAPGETPSEPPMDEGTMTDLVGYFATHYNMGHGGMVASKYAEDAFASFAGVPAVSGRAAIEAELARRIEAGASNLVIHDVRTIPLGDGLAADAGWYSVDTPDGPVAGAYMLLAEQAEDGSWMIKWHVANGMPDADAM